jgi:predicted metal-dependent hydrolase
VTEASAGPTGGQPDAELPRGRTAPLAATERARLLREGVALFNGVRYWHAHEVFETIWRAAPEEERDFYQGIIQVAAGLLHLQRRNLRGARNKLAEGLERLQQYDAVHEGLVVSELIAKGHRLLEELNAGAIPYLIPPVIKYAEPEPADFER